MEGLRCLQCGQPLDQDFGIVACTNCGAVMMIDLDGRPQLAEDSEPAVDSSAATTALPAENAKVFGADGYEYQALTQNLGSGTGGQETVFYQRPAAEKLDQKSTEEPYLPPEPADPNAPDDGFAWNPDSAVNGDGPTPEEPADTGASAFEGYQGLELGSADANFENAPPLDSSSDQHTRYQAASVDPVDGPAEAQVQSDSAASDGTENPFIEVEPVPGVDEAHSAASSWFDEEPASSEEPANADSAPSDAFADIRDFGNQDVESGALQFEMTITGIDRSDLRADLLEVLNEPRLALGVRELASQIRGGKLVIPGLSAARASIIVSRLQHLDIDLKWRQKVYES